MRGAGIAWRGNWDPSFRDFFIDRIGPYASAAPDRYWSLTVNGRFASGGCLARVDDGDTIHFSYGPLFGDPAPSAPGDPGGPDRPAGRKPTSHGGNRPVGREAARARGAGGGLSAALARGGRSGLGTAGAGAAAGRRPGTNRIGADPGQARRSCTTARSRKTSTRPPSPYWHWGAGDRVRRGRRLAGSLRSKIRAAASASARGSRPTSTPPGSPPGRWPGRGSGRRARRGGRLRPLGAGGRRRLPIPPRRNRQRPEHRPRARGAAGLRHRRRGIRSAAGETPLDFLSSLARPNGAIAYTEEANPTPAWTTAQALLGLTGRGKLLASRNHAGGRR